MPRTGGTSINECLRRMYKKYNYDNLWIIGHDLRNKNYISFPKYCRLYKKNFKSFSFVRNPWDRVVSAFNYLNQGGCSEVDKIDYEKYLAKFNGNFKKFVKEGLTKDKKILNQIHFVPQYKWLCDKKHNILVDFLGKYENLKKDFNKIIDLFDLPKISLEKTNSSKHLSYKKYYDKDIIGIIEKIYKKDIEIFNYKF